MTTQTPAKDFLQTRVGCYVSFLYRKNDFDDPSVRSGVVESITTAKNGSEIVLLNTVDGYRSFHLGRIVLIG